MSIRFPSPPAPIARFTTDPDGPLAQKVYRSRLRDDRVAALLGISLGVLFTVCFLTGVWSHLHQNPVSWLPIPSRPAGLYRITQGLHVITGIASIPVLLAKLWVVWPRFVTFPPFTSVATAVERISLLPLVGGGLFMVGTGLANVASWYPWAFDFRASHYWVAWLTIGAMIAHIGAKLTITKGALRRGRPKIDQADPFLGEVAEGDHDGLSRRGFLGVVAGTAGIVTLATAGSTIEPLRAVSVLGTRTVDDGPQHMPVNRSATEAGVLDSARAADFRLRVEGRVATPLVLSMEEIRALPLHQAALPMSCVEGWSAQGTWMGVRVRDLVRMAGGDPSREVRIESLEERGAYRTSVLNRSHVGDADTLLATHLNGAVLDIEHGYPLRLMAPNRPGVLQTKWVTKVVVL